MTETNPQLKKSYEITNKMDVEANRNPTDEQRDAKWLIYNEVISPKYNGNPPPYLEPDYMEGWKT